MENVVPFASQMESGLRAVSLLLENSRGKLKSSRERVARAAKPREACAAGDELRRSRVTRSRLLSPRIFEQKRDCSQSKWKVNNFGKQTAYLTKEYGA